MISEKVRAALIEKETRRRINNITWEEVKFILNNAKQNEERTFLDIIKKSDSKLLKNKIKDNIGPKAMVTIDRYIQNDSFPSEYVKILLKGGNNAS